VAEVGAERREIMAVLRRVRGCVEFGVRVMQQPVSRARAKATRASSGAAFLAAKKQARDDVRAATLKAAEAADDAFGLLAAIARASRRRDVEPEGVTPPLLDAAFLVPATARARFKAGARRAAADCTRAGAEMTLTGPWPPYNFVQLESAR
jgi:hypothetical protein